MKVQGITFTIDRERIKRTLATAINTGVTRAAKVYVAGIKASIGKRAPGVSSPPGSPPNYQSGDLFKSITNTPVKNGVSIVHTSNRRYAPVLEYGATIRAKPGRALPVPVGRAGRRLLKSAGPGGLRSSGVRMVMIKRKGKPPLLIRNVGGKNARSEVLFVLKKSITIKPRPFMAPAERSATLYAQAVAAFEAGATAEIRRGVK